LAVLEAMSFGCIVVATEVGGVGEAVENQVQWKLQLELPSEARVQFAP
jgi:glycosyltransferase involved in cell wall biosynthesis